MKQCWVVILAALTPSWGLAETFYSTFPIRNATIYPQGALITQVAAVDVPVGEHEIALLVPRIDRTEINRTGLPDVTVTGARVLGVRVQRHLPAEPKAFWTAEQKDLADRVMAAQKQSDDLRRAMERLHGIRAGLARQETFLASVQGTTEPARGVDDIVAISEFLPQALAQNAEAVRQNAVARAAVQHEIETFEPILERLMIQAQAAGIAHAGMSAVLVRVVADKAGPVTLASESFDHGVGWSVTYDLHLDEARQEVTFLRQAVIGNGSVHAWNDVDVILSSAEPFRNANPNLPRKNVVELIPPASKLLRSKDAYSAREVARLEPTVLESAVMAPGDDTEDGMPNPTVAGTFDGVAVEFALNQPVSLGGGTSYETYELERLTQSVTVSRYASPRWDRYAFVRASFVNETGEPLLTGQAEHHRNGNFIGQSRFSFIPKGAEATLYFGEDRNLPLTMRFLSEFKGDEGLFSRSNNHVEKLEFGVKNLSDAAQDVTVAYALPVSENEEVELRVDTTPNPSRKDVDGTKGLGEWDVALSPGQSETVAVEVKITWPEGRNIGWQP